MPQGRLPILVLIALAVAGYYWFQRPAPWTRENPLNNPKQVETVAAGVITLDDGRTLRPAGIRQADNVSAADYDRALSVAVAQGVCMVRDLGDGRAMLLCEPRFYNWSNEGKNKWAGTYMRAPLSELLIHTGYASPDLAQAGLTPHEKWRLEGAANFAGMRTEPVRLNEAADAFRYQGSERYFEDYDTSLEVLWKPPPAVAGAPTGSGG